MNSVFEGVSYCCLYHRPNLALSGSSNKMPKPIMTKATKKKKKPTASPGSITKKPKSTSSKKSNEWSLKKAHQKGKCAGV